MSSEGSVSSNGSRIRQFGLYRTIDARTEEFLRSSRKRQIRQGCACAAISTAITVTVVVSVILVYEYSINSEGSVIKKQSLKSNWIGLMNDSDITSINSKFNKKINFDRTTLKLLPILLKALNKNRYLEKILEEYSSSSPPYAGKDSTEATFTRNVFSDSKNWLKLPTTRHYTTDYKTSPLMHWKNPTQRLEYLTKIRKIRDYQRMLNYFDKMINDKVGMGQKKDFEYTENPLTAETVPMTKTDKITKILEWSNPVHNGVTSKELKPEDKEGLVICNCPKKLGLLLSKLISALQDLIPQIVSSKLGLTTCRTKTKAIEALKQLTTARTVRPVKQRINGVLTTVTMGSIRKTIKKNSKETKSIRKFCTISIPSSDSTSTTTSTAIRNTPTTTSTTTTITKTSMPPALNEFEIKTFEDNAIQMPTKIDIKMPNYQSFEKTSLNYDLFISTTESPFIQTTKSPELKHRTTEAIVPMKFIVESSTEKWLKNYILNSSYSRLNVPLFKEEEYDDYFSNKPSGKVNELENLNLHSMESLKTKTTPSRDDMVLDIGDNENNLKKTSVNVNPLNYQSAATQKDLDLTSMRKLADMIYVPREKITKLWKYTIEPELPAPSYRKYKYPELHAISQVTNSVESSVDPTTSNIFTSSLKNIIQIADSTPNVKNNHYKTTVKYKPYSLTTDQQTGDNGGDDEFQDEYLRPTESTMAPYKYKNSTKRIDTSMENMTQKSPWELMKNDEKTVTKSFKSMMPSMRPIYLEIQRNNEWRQDEHGDYDNYNFNNNIFDLPNIN